MKNIQNLGNQYTPFHLNSLHKKCLNHVGIEWKVDRVSNKDDMTIVDPNSPYNDIKDCDPNDVIPCVKRIDSLDTELRKKSN